MKSPIIVIVFLLLMCEGYSQNITERDRYSFVGMRLRLAAGNADNTHLYTLAELAMGKIAKKGISFQVRAGTDNYSSEVNGHAYIGSNKIDNYAIAAYKATGVFIKPAWVFYKSLGIRFTNYASVSVNATYTRHMLDMKISDPVYGDKVTHYEKYDFFPLSSIEFEHSNLFHLGNRADFNLSYYIGIRTYKPDIFNDVIDGFKNKTVFVPGASYGGSMYINLLLGINIHLY